MMNEHPLYYKAVVQVVTIFLFSSGEITGGDAVAGAVLRLTVRVKTCPLAQVTVARSLR